MGPELWRRLGQEFAAGRQWLDRAVVLAYAAATGLVVVAFTLLVHARRWLSPQSDLDAHNLMAAGAAAGMGCWWRWWRPMDEEQAAVLAVPAPAAQGPRS